MAWQDVLAKVEQGAAGAAGNTDAQARVSAWQDQRQQQRGDQIRFALAPLSQALQADQTRLALYANPDDPSKAVEGKEREYQDTLDRMTQTIGKMRGVLGQQPSTNPLEAGAGDALAKMHITNHLKNHVAQVRAADAAKYATDNQDMAKQYATGAIPYSQTPAAQAEAQKSADALKLADTNKTETERFVADYKAEHPGATDEEALAAQTKATQKPEVPKGLKALEQGGVAYGVENQDTGQQYLPSQLDVKGNAPPEAKQVWQTIKQAQADRQAEEQKKEDAVAERQSKTIAAGFERMGQSQQFQELMRQYSSDLQTYRTLNTQAAQSEENIAALDAQYAQPGSKAAADNELQNFYTTVVQKGGRKTAAELNLTLKIGGLGMNIEQMATKAAKGELPPELRKILLDGMKEVAKEQRAVADQTKPELPQVPGIEGPKTKAIKAAAKGGTDDPLGLFK